MFFIPYSDHLCLIKYKYIKVFNDREKFPFFSQIEHIYLLLFSAFHFNKNQSFIFLNLYYQYMKKAFNVLNDAKVFFSYQLKI